MVKHNTKRYATAMVVLSIALFLCFSFFRNNLVFKNINDIWENTTTTITIVTIIHFLFVSWAWKWKLFQGWLVPFPCLSGKWSGEIISTYKSESQPIPINVVIKQHFLNIQIQLKTDESKSVSICGSFDIDEDRGIRRLIYSYQNDPKVAVRSHSEIHYGTVRLDISDDSKTLMGEYWTDRKTTGEISMFKL